MYFNPKESTEPMSTDDTNDSAQGASDSRAAPHLQPDIPRGLAALRPQHIQALTESMGEFEQLAKQALRAHDSNAGVLQRRAKYLGQLAVHLAEELKERIRLATYRNRFIFTTIPEPIKEGIAVWVAEGREPGGFLAAVLRGDLVDAVNRADDVNLWVIPQIVTYLQSMDDVPSACWGSEEKVEQWADEHAQRRGLEARYAGDGVGEEPAGNVESIRVPFELRDAPPIVLDASGDVATSQPREVLRETDEPFAPRASSPLDLPYPQSLDPIYDPEHEAGTDAEVDRAD